MGDQEETELYPFVHSDGAGGARREVAHGGRRAAATASRGSGAPAVWAEASGSGSFVEAQGRWLGGLLAARKGGGESSAARSSLVAAMADGGGFLDFGAPEGGGPEGAAGVGRPEGAPAGGRAGWRGQPAAGTAGGRGRRRQGGRGLAGSLLSPDPIHRGCRLFFLFSFVNLGI